MSLLTLAYLAALIMCGVAAALIEGGLLWLSWLAWNRAAADAPASKRYRIACVHLAAAALAPLVTLAVLHVTLLQSAVVYRSPPTATLFAEHWALPPFAIWSMVVAALWLSGVAVMALRLAWEVLQLAVVEKRTAPAELEDAVRRLATGWIGSSPPRVRSSNVAVPQVVGLRRPVLLTPHDFMARLPARERDAVLLHELAHVARRDVGWNFAQRLILALVWFQPAAWAFYTAAAAERELCCDALAVSRGAPPRSLASGLLSLAEAQSRPDLAMAIARGGELTRRIHCLLGMSVRQASTARSPGPPIMLSFLCLMAVGTGLFVPGPAMADLFVASAFGPTVTVDARDPAGRFALQVRQGRVVNAWLQRRKLPRGQIVRRGDRVTLLNAAREPVVVIRVTPTARIGWRPRSPVPRLN